ncbi:MAG: hypothetical protein IIC00_09785 [Planctomycetes bacterium]|nr:hypothetical protein [Planctomycetota bacterium]
MNKRLMLLTLVFLMSVVPAASGFGAETGREILLRDGFVLKGIDGKLLPAALLGKSEAVEDSNTPIRPDPNLDWCRSGWFFEFGSDVNDYRYRVSAGTKLELLPSSALEKMIADVNERSAAAYRLWGWTTKYKGRNFIFPSHFLPLARIDRPQSQTAQKPKEKERSPSAKESKRQPAVSEPNDVLAIPREIMEKLKTGRIVSPERLRRTPKARKGVGDSAAKTKLEQDSILADRTAFLVKQDDPRFTRWQACPCETCPERSRRSRGLVFVLDAFGRNVRPVSLRLLPCEVLELAEQKQSAVPESVRFKIAGIVTKYKGKNYLLLQKATHAYSHQNFDR